MYENFDKEVVIEIIDIFLKEYPERISLLEADIVNRNFDGLYKHAHSVKGVISNFYDENARQWALQMETKGKNLDASGLEDIFRNFKLACDSLIAELQQIREQYS